MHFPKLRGGWLGTHTANGYSAPVYTSAVPGWTYLPLRYTPDVGLSILNAALKESFGYF